MLRTLALLGVVAVSGFGLAACGSTSYGPGGNPATQTTPAEVKGQDTNSQDATSGLKTPSYTSANNVCSLYPMAQLAQQNGLPAASTAEQIATKIAASENTPADKKAAKQGCLDGIHGIVG